MKKLFFGVCAAVLFLSAYAADLPVVSGGKSTYQILISDNAPDNLKRQFRRGAEVFRNVIFKRTGVRLSVVDESKRTPGLKALKFGYTPKEKWNLNEYQIKAESNGDILFTGDNADKPGKPGRGGDSELRLGTLTAAMEFLKKFSGADFLYPGWNGIYVEKSPKVTVPSNFNCRKTPRAAFMVGRWTELFYSLANGKFSAPWYKCHGGHSHIPAIPPKKYLKDHPEYFAVCYGKRNGYAGIPQYCLSNPEVQELIYQQLLRDVDIPGVLEAQLGQTDGFHKCECEKCKKFLGNDPGEAVWKLHLSMADRLLKDRPGKRVRIMSYWPTHNPPKFRKVFPKNTSVTLCRYSPEDFAKWKNYTVPCGFDIYTYHWGEYHVEGMTPTYNLKRAQKDVQLFLKNGVNAVYFCGFMELPGLETPVNLYYIRALNGDKTSPEALLKDFCFKVFGAKSAKAMNDFYTLLYSRVDILPEKDSDVTLIKKEVQKSIFAPNVQLLHRRYPEDVVAKLDALLKKGEAGAPGNFLLKYTRREFDYLKLTAGVCNDFYAYHAAPSQATFEKMAKRIIARKKFIQALPQRNGRFYSNTDLTIFGGLPVSMVMENGRLGGKMTTPLTWDVEYYLANNILPSGRVMKADGKDFQRMLHVFADDNRPMIKEFPIFAGSRTDAKCFYAVFRFPKETKSTTKGTWFIKFQKDAKSPCYQCWRPGAGQANFQIRVKTNEENKNMGEVFKPFAYPTPEDRIFSKWIATPGKPLELEVAIPWSIFGGKPVSGERRMLNFTWWIDRTAYTWEYNLNLLNWRHRFCGIAKVQF